MGSSLVPTEGTVYRKSVVSCFHLRRDSCAKSDLELSPTEAPLIQNQFNGADGVLLDNVIPAWRNSYGEPEWSARIIPKGGSMSLFSSAGAMCLLSLELLLRSML